MTASASPSAYAAYQEPSWIWWAASHSVGPLGGLVLAGRVQGHRGLGVVPRVEVVAPEPRDGPVLALHGEDPADGDGGLLGGEDPGQDEVFCPGGRHLVPVPVASVVVSAAVAAASASVPASAGRCGLVA